MATAKIIIIFIQRSRENEFPAAATNPFQLTMDRQLFTDLINAFTVFQTSEDFPKVPESHAKAREFLDLAADMRARGTEHSPLKLAELRAVFCEFTDIFFCFPCVSYLLELLKVLSTQFPFEYGNIRKHTELFDFTNNAKCNLLLKGDVQSGKTAIMILCALCYLVCGRDVAVLCRNSLDDVKQFKERFAGIVKLLETMGFRNKNFRIAGRGRVLTRDPCLFVYNYSERNVQALTSILEARAITTSVLFVDEADLRKGSQRAFCSLQRRVSKTIFVSATVQDILVSKWEIHANNIVKLESRPWYKGVDSLIIVEKPKYQDDELFYTLCDIAVDEEFKEKLPAHPKILLITVDRSLTVMEKFYDHFKHGHFTLEGDFQVKLPVEMQNVCVISYTGAGIKMAHDGAELPYNQPKASKSIGNALLWLARNGGAARFPTIVILAGDLGSRGINFACYDAENPANNWHVTHQILASKNTCAGAVQGLRILGNHADDAPLKLYTTTDCAEQIRKSHRLTNALVETMSGENFKGMTTRDVCKTLPVRASDKPVKYLTYEPERRALKIVKDNEASVLVEDVVEEENLNNRGTHWLVAFTDRERAVYNDVLRVLSETPEKWVQRARVRERINHDTRDIAGLHSEIRNNSAIEVRKNGRVVEYRYSTR